MVIFLDFEEKRFNEKYNEVYLQIFFIAQSLLMFVMTIAC